MRENYIKVMTYNIRYDNNWDDEHSWNKRKDLIVRNIIKDSPDIFGIQEGMINQVQYLRNNLHNYDFVGVGRGDGKEADEFSAIFYDTEKFDLLDSDTFWLSKTPEVPGSIGWDAACIRIMTWAKLKHKESGKILFHFNTHFDHEGLKAQVESAKLVIKQIQKIAINNLVVMTGDLNLTPDFEAYSTLTKSVDDNGDFVLCDVCKADKGEIDVTTTFTDFGRDNTWKRIDYIFINKYFNVQDYKIHNDEVDGVIASDHFRITANLTF